MIFRVRSGFADMTRYAVFVLMIGCGSQEGTCQLPGDAEYTGTIRTRGERFGSPELSTMLVEEDDGSQTYFDLGVATVVRRTTEFNCEDADAADLVPGLRVEVWRTGNLGNSNPAQATARFVAIVSD